MNINNDLCLFCFAFLVSCKFIKDWRHRYQEKSYELYIQRIIQYIYWRISLKHQNQLVYESNEFYLELIIILLPFSGGITYIVRAMNRHPLGNMFFNFYLVFLWSIPKLSFIVSKKKNEKMFNCDNITHLIPKNKKMDICSGTLVLL